MTLDPEQVLDFLRRELGVAAPDLDRTTSLFGSGLIDSFALVSLIAFVESRCNLVVRPADVILANWDSVDRLLAYVAARTGEGGEAPP